jgi:uncharacterized protein (DUF2141 family)
MRIMLIGAIASLMVACASIGRPSGGPKDEVPPEFVRSNPEPGALNVDRNRIDLWFNENIQLDDAANKVVVSPVQKETARVSANGRHLTVEFRDSLADSTTYVIDFADAIRDLNESNILDGFAYEFSTGAALDTLTISGMLFQARNLEPAQSMVVGVYSNLADSAISTLKMERVTKTNQLGQFTIRGLKPGAYNIFAIDDKNSDWHWDRSENIAFYPLQLSPSTEPVMVVDTLRSSLGTDSIVTRRAYHYMPDDVLLTWFNENYRSQYLRDNKRPTQRYMEFKFGARLDSMPQMTILNGKLAGRRLEDLSVIEGRAERDSLIYWMRDTALVNQDSILIAARYQKTDSLDQLAWQTDTLKMFYRRPKVKEKKQEKKPEQADSLANDSLPPITFLALKATTQTPHELNLPVRFEAPEPLEPVDPGCWRLEMLTDTIWHKVNDAKLVPDTATPRALLLTSLWKEGQKYRFVADSAQIMNIYGEFNKPFTHEFTTKTQEDYGNIYLNITDLAALGLPDSARVFVELLASGDKLVTKSEVKNGTATFNYIAPSTYYARLFIDNNSDGEWTTGNLALKRLPEDVFYFPKKLKLRKNWDIEEDWALLATPVDLQKPEEIKQNKPKTKGKQQQSTTDEDEEEDEFGTGQSSWGNGSQYNNAGKSSSINRGGRATQRQY